MDAESLITRAKIQIQKKNNFFAYLSLFLKFKEVKKGELQHDSMGVDEKGNCYYCKEFVEEITSGNNTEQLEGVITHEILHLALLHLIRVGERDKDGFNCATDLVINTLLRSNGFSLPKGALMPDYDNKIACGNGKIIKDIDKKTAEEVYDEIPKVKMKGNTYVLASGKDKGKELGESFDEHMKGKGKDGKSLSPKERAKLEKNWLDKVSEAVNVARMKGDIPVGLERLVGKLFQEEIDWKSLLQKYIINSLPYDYTYCVDKNTFVETPKGKIKIKDLKINQKIYGLKNGKIVLNKVKETFKSNVKKKFIIYTKSGKRLICSGEHKILTPNGYKKAKDLNIGELCITT